MRLIDADKLLKDIEQYHLSDGMFQHWVEVQPTIEEQKKDNWIPIETRPMDEDERKEWSEKLGYKLEDYEAVIYMSLPDDGQEVLTCSRYGHIAIDKFENDPDYGCCFEENGDIDGIVAWMPLPEPWGREE